MTKIINKEQLLLNMQGDSSNIADINYIKDQQLLLIPIFKKNKVVAQVERI